MDAIYYSPEKNRKRKLFAKKIFFSLFFIILAAGAAYGSFFAYKTYSVGKKISAEATQEKTSFVETVRNIVIKNPINLRSSANDRINILLLGIAGKGKPGQYLTDTIMIASLSTKTNRVALISIPRDLFVRVPDMNIQMKINSVYQYGLANLGGSEKGAGLISKTIKDITSLNMDYYAILNFSGFEKIIDDIGGINIISERDIYDPSYPGPNYSYETFELSKGFHELDGATALKYARERHNDPEGDFGRAKRQQQIMQATKNKIFSAATIFNPVALNNLLDTLGENIVTDIKPEEIGSFLELSKKLDTQNINNVVVDAWDRSSLLKVSHVSLNNTQAFVLVPRVGNWSEVHDLAQNVFDLNQLTRRKNEIESENASVTIINQSGNNGMMNRIKKLLSENLDYKNVSVLNHAGKKLADKTTVYDFTNGAKPFSLDELATKLPAAVSYSIDPAQKASLNGKNTDMLLVIGEDLVPKYNMEEGTIEDLNKSRDDQEYINLSTK